ncbi:MAG: GNAT family N-acetyltransferase [archaeon]
MIPKFHEITADKFGRYEKQILRSEEIFPEQIRTSREDYMGILMSENSIALVATIDSKYIGNIIGCPITEEDMAEYEIDFGIDREKILYVYNIVIDNAFQGRGYGHEMMKEFIRIAKMRGYEVLAGHFRKYRSESLIRKFGAVAKKTYANWDNSGEEYILCVLDLRNVKDLRD